MRIGRVLLVVASFHAIQPPLRAAEPPAGLLGRWDLTVDLRGQARPAWLELRMQDGKTVGRSVGLWGGTHDLGEVKIEDNAFRFTDEFGTWQLKYAAPDLVGELIGPKGDARLEGTHKITGKRFVAKANVAGRWSFTAEGGGPSKGTLVFNSTRRGDLTAALRVDGTRHPIEKPSVDDGVLTFQLKEGTYTGRVRGDRIEGTFKLAGGDKEGKWSARKQIAWSPPRPLFNGKDLSGWKPLDNEDIDNWKVENGELVNTRPGGNIRTVEEFDDLKLHVEFKVPKDGNSGVYLRGRYEVQILDSYGRPPRMGHCGSMYGRLVPPIAAEKPAGEWQTFDVTLVGQYLTLVYNDKLIFDNVEIEGITGGAIDSREEAPGPIYLQGDHSGDIRFRNITISRPEPTTTQPARQRRG